MPSEAMNKKLAEILLKYIPSEKLDSFLDELEKNNIRFVTSNKSHDVYESNIKLSMRTT